MATPVVYYSNVSVAYRLKLVTTQTSQDINNNRSYISWELYLEKTNSAYSAKTLSGDWFRVAFSYGSSTNVVLNDVKTWDLYSKTSVKIASGSNVAITHDTDGSRTLKVEASFSPTITQSYYPTRLSLTSTMPLTKIPRATTPKLYAGSSSSTTTSMEISNSFRLAVQPASTSFKHDITLKIGSTTIKSWTGIASSASWSFTSAEKEKILNALNGSSKGSGTFTVTTKNGSTTIGSKTLSVTLSVNSTTAKNYPPSISSISLKAVNPTSDLSDTQYVQEVTKVTISLSLSAQYKASIKEVKAVINGLTYTGNASTTSTISINKLQNSGEIPIKVTVTDSRGATATTTQTITVLPYSKPVIYNFTADRATSEGVVDDDGTCVQLKFNMEFDELTNATGNTITISKVDKTTSVVNSQTNLMFAQDLVVMDYEGLDAGSSCKYKITAKDSFGKSTSYEVSVPIAFSLVDFGAGGKSIAIGKTSQDNGEFEIAMPVSFQKEALYSLMSIIYPLGSIIITENDDNPSVRFGGVWVPCGVGRVLVGAGTVSDGTESRTFKAYGTGGKFAKKLSQADTPWKLTKGESAGFGLTKSESFKDRVAVSNTGTVNSFDLLSPYLVVHYWRRVKLTGTHLTQYDVEVGTVSESQAKGTSWEVVKTAAVTSKTRLRAKDLVPIQGNSFALASLDGMEVFICWFDANQLYLGSYVTWRESGSISIPAGAKYAGMAFRLKSQADTTPDDFIKGVVAG